MKKNFKFLTTVLKTFGLRPSEPSVAVAVAEGAKPSATAVEIRPSVDPWTCLMWTVLYNLEKLGPIRY